MVPLDALNLSIMTFVNVTAAQNRIASAVNIYVANNKVMVVRKVVLTAVFSNATFWCKLEEVTVGR